MDATRALDSAPKGEDELEDEAVDHGADTVMLDDEPAPVDHGADTVMLDDEQAPASKPRSPKKGRSSRSTLEVPPPAEGSRPVLPRVIIGVCLGGVVAAGLYLALRQPAGEADKLPTAAAAAPATTKAVAPVPKPRRGRTRGKEAPASLRIRCKQAGATVSINGQMVGTTPLARAFSLRRGLQEVIVSKAGYKQFHQLFPLSPGEKKVLAVTLYEGSGTVIPAPPAQPPAPANPASPARSTRGPVVVTPSWAQDEKPAKPVAGPGIKMPSWAGEAKKKPAPKKGAVEVPGWAK